MNHCFRLVLIVLFLVEISFCNNSILLDDYSADESSILSESHNLTVNLNETVQLPCIVKKSPNTVVIWNQCEDPHCNQMRSPLTINKDNFIQDLRFRIVSENILLNNNNTIPAAISNSEQQIESNDFDLTTKKKKSAINERETNDDQQQTATKTSSSDDAMSNSELINTDVNSWNLEIRKFSKNDEGCYQCQLNSFKTKTIYYCIKLQKKVTTKHKKVVVHLDEPIKLKCSTDENVRMSSIKWYRNGHKINEENNSNLQVERVPSHDLIYSTLLIHRATLNDAGTYMCKFEKIHEKIHVDVVIGLKSDKSSVVRSNMENKKLVSSFSDSITAASNANHLKNLNYLIWITISSLIMLC